MSINNLLDTPPGGTPAPHWPRRDQRDDVPNLRPSWRQNLKDLLLIATVAAGIFSWIWQKARTYVESAEFLRYTAEQKIENDRRDDHSRALEREVYSQSATTESIQKTVDRIEAKVDDRRRK